LDRLMGLCTAATAVLVAAGCGSGGGRPARLLDGRPAARFEPIDGSVIAFGRVVELDARADRCLTAADRASVAPDAPAVERIGVNADSLTFTSRDGSVVYACDGGVDPAGERAPPWCHAVVGELENDRVLDPRLDVICNDPSRRSLAYAFVDPIAGARWIGVRQDGYVELYEVLGGLPVRVASTSGIDVPNARATFEISQYDASGRELAHGEMEAAVAG
jgi:hypothetical protein